VVRELTITHKKSEAVRSGFTLIELVIVILILGVMGTMVVPKFLSAVGETQDSTVRMNLSRVRSQLQLYQVEHGIFPDMASFSDQMIHVSDEDGNTAAPGTDGFQYGPYLREVPKNPFSGASSVGNGAIGSSDWYYDESTGEFRANDSPETFAY
jgi:general secretion pathway protein G